MTNVRQCRPGELYKDQEPEFLRRRVTAYYEERVKKIWQGRRSLMTRTPGPGDVHLFNNDYLAIANHPVITEAQIRSLRQSGNGPMMSQVFFTDENPQATFESNMASFMNCEDTLVCQSGWCANTGLLQSIVDKDTPVYIDLVAHMSLWEGILSAGARARPFRHNDMAHLEQKLKRYGPGVVVVDSVYSTMGDVCSLRDAVALSKAYGCLIVVDESHSLGTHGPNGAGLVSALGLTEQVDFRTSSLAKAFAGRGGLIAGSKRLLDYVRHEARPMIFSSAVLPTDLAAFNAALSIIRQDEWRREAMRDNADFLRAGLADLGYNVTDSKSQIISLEPGPEEKALQLRDALEARGIFGAIFFPPATPKNRAMIRFSVDASVTQAELERVLVVCHEIKGEVDMANWRSTLRLNKPARKTALAGETCDV